MNEDKIGIIQFVNQELYYALDKQEMFDDQTSSNIVGDQTFYRLATLFEDV